MPIIGVLAIAGCEARHEPVSPRIVPGGTARVVDFPGAPAAVLLESSATHGDVAVLEVRVPPGSIGAPPHVHHDEDEYLYVLEGELQLLDRSEVVAASAGTFAALTRDHLHAFWNASSEPARLLVVIAPGRFAGFFDQVVAELRANEGLPPAAVGEMIASIGREWNIEVRPDLLPEEARRLLPR